MKTLVVAVLDFEWTTNVVNWPGATRDIIEMGGCTLHLPAGEIAQVWNADIRPTRAKVSRHCTTLTGITVARAANGMAFAAAAETLYRLFGQCDSWASFGPVDKVRLEDQCTREGCRFPLSGPHIDIRALAMKHFNWKERKNLTQVVAAIGGTFAGQRHTALSDARNAATVLHYLSGTPAFNPGLIAEI